MNQLLVTSQLVNRLCCWKKGSRSDMQQGRQVKKKQLWQWKEGGQYRVTEENGENATIMERTEAAAMQSGRNMKSRPGKDKRGLYRGMCGVSGSKDEKEAGGN